MSLRRPAAAFMAVTMVALLLGCGNDNQSGDSGTTTAPGGSASGQWHASQEVTVSDGWRYRITVTMGASTTDADPSSCLYDAKPGTIDRAATVALTNLSDRSAPIPEVTVSLTRDGKTINGQWGTAGESCALSPWHTTFGDHQLGRGETTSNAGGFTEVPDEWASTEIHLSVNSPDVVGGGGDDYTIQVPPLDSDGHANGDYVEATTTTLATTAQSIVCTSQHGLSANAANKFAAVAVDASCDVDGETDQMNGTLVGDPLNLDPRGHVIGSSRFSGRVQLSRVEGPWQNLTMTVVITSGADGTPRSTWAIDSGFGAGLHASAAMPVDGPIRNWTPPTLRVAGPLTFTAG